MKVEIPDFKEFVHYNKGLEASVLGAILIERFAYEKVMGILNPECFYYDSNKIVYEAISDMWGKMLPIDLLTLTQYIVRNKGIETLANYNVPYYLSKLTGDVVSSANIVYHSFLIRQLHAEREMVKIKYGNLGMGDGDIVTRSKRMQDELLKLSQFKVTDDWEDMIEGVMELHAHMDHVKDKDLIGIPTGFSKVDYITGGFCGSQLIVIAARPSVGKSALLNSLCLHAAEKGFNVGIISLEMPTLQMTARMGAVLSQTEFYKIFRNRLYDDTERDKVYGGLEKLANLPIKITDKTNVSVMDIRAKCAQLINKKKLDILFIDYLQLVDGDTGNKNALREQEVAKMSRGLKIMSMEYKIPVVVLAQLNRESEKEKDKKPKLHHLRESGAIEQDADIVMFLHRDFKAGITHNADGASTEFEADIILAKTRNGETPEIKIGFTPAQMRFYDKDYYHPPSPPPDSIRKPYKDDDKLPF